jgi:caffeoyl-CoA O-methyltransferase
MDIVHPAVEDYMRNLFVVDDEPVLLEMEKLAERKGFPIIGRLCGRALEVMARAVGARRIFELGSGFGYSAYWFSKATGPGGEIHLTDTDPDNEEQAMDFLGRADLADPIRYHVGDAFEKLSAVEGDFDVVYCDIEKGDYPRAWETARERVRVGGLYACDNMLWSGRVTGEASQADVSEGWTEAIAKTNRMIAEDEDFREFILPTRDGVVFALRVS